MHSSRTIAVELAVIGGGMAGLVAANRAAELGRRVLVLEKGVESHYLCNTRISGGALHICMRDIDGDPDELLEAIARCTDRTAQSDLAKTLVDDAPRARNWLRERGISFARVPLLKQDNVLAPLRPNRAGPTWQGRGGDVLLRTLEAQLAAQGGQILRGAAAVELLMKGDTCTGVAAVLADGSGLRVDAAAVLVADGGWQNAPDFLLEHVTRWPRKLKQRNAATGCGDGARLARAVGADLTGMDAGFYGHLLCRDAITDERLWPFPIMDFLASSAIVVDASGQRVCDEDDGGITIANRIAALDDPLGTVVIFDEAIWHGPGRFRAIPPNPHLVLAGGSVYYQNSIEALALELGMPAATLAHTVANYNAALEGGTLASLVPPRGSASYTAWPIVKPPFYAVRLCAGVTFAMGGIHIDAQARVLRRDHTPIAGLYAAGAATGGLDGGPRSGYVGGLMKSAVFGMRAAQALSR